MIDTVINDYAQNTYIIADGDSAFVIDPGSDHEALCERIAAKGLTVVGVLMTHGHFDHMLGLEKLLEKWSVPVYVHQDDEPCLFNAEANLSSMSGQAFALKKGAHEIRTLKGGEKLPCGDASITVVHTPGHTPGGVCYGFKDALFTGDSIFKETVGRSDFPGGSARQLADSVRKVLDEFPEETYIYPGHGDRSTVGHERKKNFFYRSA